MFHRIRHTIDIEALFRIVILNRLCDPRTKLSVLRWTQAMALPAAAVAELTRKRQLSRVVAVRDNQDTDEEVTASLLRSLVDDDLWVDFYDMATSRAEGLATVDDYVSWIYAA